MSFPIDDRNEYPISTLGFETYPQGIVVKNSLWSMQIGFNRLILKDYEGIRYTFDTPFVKSYRLTFALKNDLTIDSDRMWVWAVTTDNVLSLYEIEPFTSANPIVTYSKLNITTNVDSISSYVSANDSVRLSILYLNGDFRALTFANIRNADPPLTYDLVWAGTRLNEFYNTVTLDKTTLQINYLDTSSPPNVYTDSYAIDIPTNFTASQIGDTNQVALSWDAVTLVTGYILERDTNPLFPDPEIYTTTGTSYTDTITEVATYYYRVRAVNDPLAIQSLWSDSQSIEITLITDFEGIPLIGLQPLSVQFTDLSTPIGAITAWDWDFGDGTPHSTEQNPLHVYESVGAYTVTLTSYVGAFSVSEVKTFYVTVVHPDFEGTPLIGTPSLSVQFTDLSTPVGAMTAWDWDFGDETPHSTEQNPLHVYESVGVYTVTLTSYAGEFSASEVKTFYVTVFSPDFVGEPLTGLQPLSVQFTDLSTPVEAITAWDWDFGDGTPHSTEQNPLHIYYGVGLYTVTLTSYVGLTSAAEVKTFYVSVFSSGFLPDFIATPLRAYVNEIIQFTDLSTGDPTEWDWNFGDRSVHSTEQNPVHSYSSPGFYTVTLRAGSGLTSNSITKVNYIEIVYEESGTGFVRGQGPTLIFD